MTDGVTPQQFVDAEGLEDWRVVGDGACAFYRADSFATSARFVQGIAEAIGAEGRQPDLDIRNGGVTVRLITITEDYAGMTRRDIEVAQRVAAVAREQGVTADPSLVQSLLVVVGSKAPSEVMPFWQAALGYERRADSPDEDLVDPGDRGPGFWFEAMQTMRPDGGGAIHVAVWLPYEEAEARISAALAAGGRIVRDDFAPSWWTLADAAGNEIDVSTVEGRG
jgi:4a-hydroxytetrahydrobiopterin dehydratase